MIIDLDDNIDYDNLTERQKEILICIAKSNSFSEAARTLGCTYQNISQILKTIKNRKTRENEQTNNSKKQRKTNPTKGHSRRQDYSQYISYDLTILTGRERRIILGKIAGKSHADLSEEMGVSVSTVGVILYRATCKLKGIGTYEQNHKEKLNAQQKMHRKNRTPEQLEKQKIYQKKYQTEHAKRLQKYNKEYYLKNRNKILQKQKLRQNTKKGENKMKWLVKYDSEIIGSVTTNHSMTDEEICETAGIDLARTQEDYEGAPENGKYILENLEIVEEPQ